MSPMSPRLLRPVSGIHPDAMDWRSRVIANGGSVSGTTMSAVSRFCRQIAAAGIRDRFLRLNLLCGNSDASLNAVRTPLYRGASLSGTQLGNAMDTNVNFVAGDYQETGSSGGLQGNASNKFLQTGLLASNLDRSNTHASVYGTDLTSGPNFTTFIGARGASQVDILQLDGRANGNPANIYFSHSTPASLFVSGSPVASSGHVMGVSRTSTDLQMYVNGASTGSQTGDRTTGALVSQSLFIFVANANGLPNTGFYTGMLCRHYSIGLGMTAQQAASFYLALQSFQTALGRQA
jgi:hypothetical protein